MGDARGGARGAYSAGATAASGGRWLAHRRTTMSKGLDRKREDKKKPAKTAKEKKEAKREKKAGKPFAPA